MPVVLAATAAANLLVLVVAQVGDGGAAGDIASAVSYLLNFGVLGLVTVAWMRRWIRPGADVVDADGRTARAEARAEAAESRERALEATFRGEVVPAMTRFTEAAARLLDRSR